MKAGSLASNIVIKNNSRLCGGSLASHNVMKSTKIGGGYGGQNYLKNLKVNHLKNQKENNLKNQKKNHLKNIKKIVKNKNLINYRWN